MNLNILLGLLIFATLAATYVFYVRPLLKATPSLGYLYQDEERFWRAVKVKFDGLKQRVLTAAISAACFIVMAYDTIAPYVATAGVDVSKIAPMIPPDAWPLIGLGSVLLLGYFRKLGERSMLNKIASGESVVTVVQPDPLNPAAPAAPVVTLTPAAALSPDAKAVAAAPVVVVPPPAATK